MLEFNLVVVAMIAAQTLAAIVMAVLLLGFFHQYHKSYLRHWTLSWAALAIYQLLSGLGLGLAVRWHVASDDPARIALSALTGIVGYLQIAWLLFGVYEILRRRPVRIRFYWRSLIVIAIAALVPSLLFIGPAAVSSTRYFMRVGLHSLISSAAFLGASYAFWRARKRRRGGEI